MNKNIFILLAGIAVVPVGCSMAPKYERPAAPVPAEWPKGAAYTESVKAGNVTNASLINWQEFFTDAQLKKVIGIALTNNRDLKLAALNVRRAQGMYGIQRDALFPSLNANGTMGRYVAKNIVAAGLASRAEIQFAYAIGYPDPVSICVDTFGTGTVPDEKIEEAVRQVFSFKPAAIIKQLNLLRPIFSKTTNYGHFGKIDDLNSIT